MSEYNINSQYTLVERAKVVADGKRAARVIDVIDKLGVGEVLRDIPYFGANQGLKHRIIRTASEAAATRRSFYQGVTATIGTTQVIHEPVILFEKRVAPDEDHLDTIENPKQERRRLVKGAIRRIAEDFVNAIFNDNRTSGSEYIQGLAARLGTLSYPGHTTTTLPYVWNNGGSGSDLCSVYIVEWGEDASHCLYPSGGAVRGAKLGIIARNKGKEAVADTDDSTAVYYAYVTQLKKWAGLAVNDARKVTRIANVERDKASANALDEDLIIEALNHGRFNIGATRMYMNAYAKTQVDIRAKDKGNVNWTPVNVFGKPVMSFLGIPIRVLDETILTGTESAVS